MRASVLLSLVLLGCSAAPAAPALPTPPPAVQVDTVQRQALAAARTLHGVTRARQEAQLSFAVAGPIDQLFVDVGDTVAADQPLARLDPSPFRHRVLALQASHDQAAAALAQAERDRDRLASLADTESVSAQQLEQLRTQVDSLTAALSALDAQLQEARWAAGQATLRSPLAGVVTARRSAVGELAGPAVPAFSLRAQSGIEIEVSAPERLIRDLAVGQTAQVSFPLAGIPDREGTIEAVSQAAAPGVGLFPVRVRLPDAPDLRPGLTATVQLRGDGADALTVPLAAVVSPAGAEAVVHRVEAAHVASVRVSLGSVEGERVVVEGDLRPGDEVVVRGHVGLNDGALVEVRR